MTYQRKIRDEYAIELYYFPYGWETVTWEETYHEARSALHYYRVNKPGVPHRIRHHRIALIEAEIS